MKAKEINLEEIFNQLKNSTSAKGGYMNMGKFSPSLDQVFLNLDFLDKKDIPNGILLNSIYFSFIVDLINNKVELHHCGHIYLSENDKKIDKYKYLCMKSMEKVYVDMGGKKFRRSNFKDINDLIKKVSEYTNNVMKSVVSYTGGYPYKRGI
jgi:hypothetical protein